MKHLLIDRKASEVNAWWDIDAAESTEVAGGDTFEFNCKCAIGRLNHTGIRGV